MMILDSGLLFWVTLYIHHTIQTDAVARLPNHMHRPCTTLVSKWLDSIRAAETTPLTYYVKRSKNFTRELKLTGNVLA